jgi:hypothetical protein
MAKRKETLLDRVSEVRAIIRAAELGLGMTPDEAAEGLMKAGAVIEELMHRRYLAAHALDLQATEITAKTEFGE